MISLTGRHQMDNSEVGTLVLKKFGQVEGNSISVISLKAPDNAKKEYSKAREAMQKKKYDDVEKHAAKAVEIYPNYASAWQLRGEAQEQQQHNDEASKSFEAAINADDKYVSPYLHLAQIMGSKQDWKDVIRLTAKAI